jgi:hypothetical protein
MTRHARRARVTIGLVVLIVAAGGASWPADAVRTGPAGQAWTPDVYLAVALDVAAGNPTFDVHCTTADGEVSGAMLAFAHRSTQGTFAHLSTVDAAAADSDTVVTIGPRHARIPSQTFFFRIGFAFIWMTVRAAEGPLPAGRLSIGVAFLPAGATCVVLRDGTALASLVSQDPQGAAVAYADDFAPLVRVEDGRSAQSLTLRGRIGRVERGFLVGMFWDTEDRNASLMAAGPQGQRYRGSEIEIAEPTDGLWTYKLNSSYRRKWSAAALLHVMSLPA